MHAPNADDNDTRNLHRTRRGREAKKARRKAKQRSQSFSRKAQMERDKAQAAFFYTAANTNTPLVESHCSVRFWAGLGSLVFRAQPVTHNLNNLSKLRSAGQAAYLARKAGLLA